MYTEDNYNSEQIRADISFLKYQLSKNCRTTLIAGTGIAKLIEDCENYFVDPVKYHKDIKAIHILYTLVGSLKLLWFRDIDFCQQLNSLNTGDYEYGKVSPEKEFFYKDFEFEIFTTAILARSGLNPSLPNHTVGNDIFCNDIEIQCKHPDIFSTNGIDQKIRNFNNSLINNETYGIFAIAVEDSFEYSTLQTSDTPLNFEIFLDQKRKHCDKILKEILEKSLVRAPKILGVLVSASYYKINQTTTSNFHFVRDTNSIFCFRPDRREIKDEMYKKAYKILYSFNPSPTMLTIEKGKIITQNNQEYDH